MDSYVYRYVTSKEFSDIFMRIDGGVLTRIWFSGSRNDDGYKCGAKEIEKREMLPPVLEETCCWFDIYFRGQQPDFVPLYRMDNLTLFRQEVLEIVKGIPYGDVVTYGDIASEIAIKRNLVKMSAQAVGGALGWNPICIIIPCHRVLGTNGALTGYGGGVANKISLLTLERSILNV